MVCRFCQAGLCGKARQGISHGAVKLQRRAGLTQATRVQDSQAEPSTVPSPLDAVVLYICSIDTLKGKVCSVIFPLFA